MMYYLHGKAGNVLSITERNLDKAIEIAKSKPFPVQISTKHRYKNGITDIKGGKEYFRIVYAHVPDGANVKGWQMGSAMFKAGIQANVRYKFTTI
jgi:hypothetical protein